MVAAKGGALNDAARDLEGLGAKIGYRDNALGYLRATIALDKVDAAAQLASIQALDVDETVDVPEPRPEGVAGVIAQPAPGAGTPRANPYMPTNEIGSKISMRSACTMTALSPESGQPSSSFWPLIVSGSVAH